MSIVLVGGMDRLGSQYQKEAQKMGMQLQIFSQLGHNVGSRIKGADAVVIFTNMISHKARNLLLLLVDEARIAIDRRMAMKIMVRR